jgi:HrpA-like RNA helicase
VLDVIANNINIINQIEKHYNNVIIIGTNIVEASTTIENLDIVIETGWFLEVN